jgi:hypothetical protein
MANWLDKYEQGGMVLKQKTKDNYGKQGNYNDAQVSTPPGYVGMGYDTKGRNYSPAWGGQFADGGKVYKSKPMAQSSDIKSASNTLNADDFSNYSTIINKYPNMSNDTSYMYARNTPTGTEQFFHNTNQGKPVSQLQRGNEFVNLSPEQINAYKQKVLTGTGGFAMGGSMPGAVGFTYARVAGSAPANGKYTKKTKASAQNGMEMKFYQEGLDFKPKTISKNGSKVIKDNRGQWAHPGKITEIGSNDITMQGVDYPVLGISDTGDTQMMQPGQDYKFDGKKVTEFPMAQSGIVVNDPKDSRLKAYQDSLTAYNKSNDLYKQLLKQGKEGNQGIKEQVKDKMSLKEVDYRGSVGMPYSFEGIKPDYVLGTRTPGENRGYLPHYKKPIQPVEYQAPKTEVKTVKGSKKYFINETQVDEPTFNKIVPKKEGMHNGGWLNKYK